MKSLEAFHNHPEFRRYSEIIDQLDTGGTPEIVFVHRTSQPIKKPEKKLGIFSGSFNPITVAHTKMIEEAQKQFQLDEILLLLAKANVDKDVFGLPLAARILTLKRFAETGNELSIGISSHGRYIDKVAALKAFYPVNTEYHFIVGYDTLVRIFDAKYYSDLDAELGDLFSQCRFIVANRENVDIETINHYLAQPSQQPYRQFIDCLILPDSYKDISSTEARKRLERGDTISHLVPSVIEEFFE